MSMDEERLLGVRRVLDEFERLDRRRQRAVNVLELVARLREALGEERQ